jgi:hypothetical protein
MLEVRARVVAAERGFQRLLHFHIRPDSYARRRVGPQRLDHRTGDQPFARQQVIGVEENRDAVHAR